MALVNIFGNVAATGVRGEAQQILPVFGGCDAKAAFEAGRSAARAFRGAGRYAVLAGSEAGTRHALAAVAAALGYGAEAIPDALKGKGLFEKLDATAPMLSVYAAGFALEVSRRYPVVLEGGLEMAAALLIADKIAGRDGLPMDPRHITWRLSAATAREYGPWLVELFGGMDFTPRALYDAEER